MSLTPQQLPAENLGDITKPRSNRGSGLAGLVADTGGESLAPAPNRPNRPAAPPVPDLDEPTVRAVPEPTPEPKRAARKPGRPRTRTKPTSAVYVSSGVKARFEKYRHAAKSTNLHVVLEAISDQHKAGKLADIIKESKYSTAPTNDLFPADPSAVRYLGGGSAQIAFSPTPEQEEVIDRIGADLGFDTRSTWIAPVLNAFLPGRKDTAP